LKALEEDVRGGESSLNTLVESVEILLPYVTNTAENEITNNQKSLVDKYQTLKIKMNETSERLHDALEQGQDLRSELDSFYAFLNETEGKLDGLKEVYTDDVESASNIIRVGS